MNSKWHLYISTIKSAIRILSCMIGMAIGDITIKIICGGFLYGRNIRNIRGIEG